MNQHGAIPQASLCLQADVTYPSVPFEHFSTNASGTITAWRIDLSDSPISGYYISTDNCTAPSGPGGPIPCTSPATDLAGPIASYSVTSGGYIQNQPGAWSATTTSTVPEPSSLLLVGSGLGVAITRMRRKLRK